MGSTIHLWYIACGKYAQGGPQGDLGVLVRTVYKLVAGLSKAQVSLTSVFHHEGLGEYIAHLVIIFSHSVINSRTILFICK